ncbi:MAG: universal stress protein [Gammaproteobacteria bacterium]|nr:universal stress protein [Gammaproteobacteria bacterium]MBT4491874.1 universal stress protein [Gammaproteobacteria bacterium]
MKVIAVVDPRDKTHHALERCRQLPTETDLDIQAVLYIESASAEDFRSIYSKQSKWLKEQVQPFIDDGYKITTEVVPFQKLYEAVIETAQKHKVDFIVKPMRQHSLFQSVVRTSTDWNLIRHCHFPLMLVSDQGSNLGKPVLASVDVCSGDANHEALNDIVVAQAKLLSGVLGSEVGLVNAWRAATPMMAVGSVDATPYPTPSDLQKEHREAALQLAEKHDLEKVQIHVEEGAPSYVVNHVANTVNAGLIVMGTVARKGISGALIGNTAEGVLEGTDCDVLVVKLPV